MSRPVAIFIADDSDFDPEDDEYRVWQVFAGDDDGEPIGPIYSHRNETCAWNLARRMSRERGLPIEPA